MTIKEAGLRGYLTLIKEAELMAMPATAVAESLKRRASQSNDVGQLRAGYKKDGELVFTEAIRNSALWKRQATRQALRDIAWGIVENDKHSDLLAAHLFKSTEKEMRRQHPAWFCDDNESGVQATAMPTSKRSLPKPALRHSEPHRPAIPSAGSNRPSIEAPDELHRMDLVVFVRRPGRQPKAQLTIARFTTTPGAGIDFGLGAPWLAGVPAS
jgi:hypothetical protein